MLADITIIFIVKACFKDKSNGYITRSPYTAVTHQRYLLGVWKQRGDQRSTEWASTTSNLNSSTWGSHGSSRQVLAAEECESFVTATGPFTPRQLPSSKAGTVGPLHLQSSLRFLLPINVRNQQNAGITSTRPPCIVRSDPYLTPSFLPPRL